MEAGAKKKHVLRMYSPWHERSPGNNVKESLDFVFNGVFDVDASQEEVFEGVATSVVLK
jgi:hypothetical protein